MAQSNELAKTRIITQDGVVNATVLDKVSPDRVALMLFKGAASAKFGGTSDQTPLVSRSLKDLLIFPFSEL